MLTHVVETLRQAVDEVVVVSSAGLEPPPVDAALVYDEQPDLGPLAGLCTGLAHTRAPLAYVTGTDAPRLTPAFVDALLGFGGAAAPERDGFVQTLAAVYPRAALDRGRELLARGRRRPLALLEACGFRRVLPSELPDTDAARGFNTPDEYLAAVHDAFGSATARLELLGCARLRARRSEIEVPVGSLAAVLAHAGPELELCRDGRVTAPFVVSLNGRDFVRDGRIPVGPGERVIVLDAAAGG
jgi:molybdopterin-guanine dinucleotide biosynthesis protein A